MPLTFIAVVFVLKAIASVISLGSGFRGGLFFATLLLGVLGGRLFAAGFDTIWPGLNLDPNVYAIVGMSALSASVIGGPLTMSFIALESTGNLWLTTAVLVAVIISTQITRELFGYSFATWRLHLRGETIRSAADVGWIRDLTVGRLMRQELTTVSADMRIEQFRGKFPLGSKNRVVAVDAAGRYVGLALVAEAHALSSTPRKPSRLSWSKPAANSGRSEFSAKPTRCGAMRKNPNNGGAKPSAISSQRRGKARQAGSKQGQRASHKHIPGGTPCADCRR